MRKCPINPMELKAESAASVEAEKKILSPSLTAGTVTIKGANQWEYQGKIIEYMKLGLIQDEHPWNSWLQLDYNVVFPGGEQKVIVYMQENILKF